MKHPIVRCAILAAALAAHASAPAGARVVAIGDIHGSLEGLLSILRETGLAGEDGTWSGGRARMVQTGDFTDRGDGVRAVMEVLMNLQRQARAARGEVTVLLGNHELLNLMRADDDVMANPRIYASFADERSEERRRRVLAQWRQWRRQRDEIEGLPRPATATEEDWLARHPLGFVEYHDAMAPNGRYGRWLRKLPVALQIDDTVFLHGGISSTFTRFTLEQINELHRREIEALDETLALLRRRGVIAPYSTWHETLAELDGRLAAPELKKNRSLIEEARQRLERIQVITGSADSPLWFRGFAVPPYGLGDDELAALRETLFEAYGARHFVVAHSPFHGDEIAIRLGSFFLIDTGMLAAVYEGRPSALEISDEGFAAVYPGQRRMLQAAGEAPAAAPSAIGGGPRPARIAATGAAPFARLALASAGRAGSEDGSFVRPPRRWLDKDGEPLPFAGPEDVENFLRFARVVSQEPVGQGKTGAMLLELEHQGIRARAVFHDIEDRRGPGGGRGPIRLSGGTTMLRFRDSYTGQVAAYRLARLMGLDNVPPAVVREVDGVEGSVALWIEGGTDLTAWRQDHPSQPKDPYYEQQLYDLRIFDALINNKDRNTGNIFWTPDWNMWLIDHTRAFAQDSNLYRPGEVQRCSRDLLARIRALDEKQAIAALKPYLSVFEVKAIFKRRKRLLGQLDERIRKLGEERVLFDYGDPLGQVTVEYSRGDAA